MLLAGCRKNDPFSPAGGGVDTTPEVWVSMGQSQMSGEGAGPFPPHPSIVMYQNAPPMGMGYAFAIERAKLGHPVTLIQCAVGGTPMSVWTSGGYLYEACIDKIIASELIVTGFVFDQGAQDANYAVPTPWAELFVRMVINARSRLSNTNLIVVYGETGQWGDNPYPVNIDHIRQEQKSVSLPKTFMAASADVIPLCGGWHFCQEEMTIVAKRMNANLMQ